MKKFIQNHTISLIVWLLIVIVSVFTLPNLPQLVRDKGQTKLPSTAQSQVADSIQRHWGYGLGGTDQTVIVFSNGDKKITPIQQDTIENKIQKLQDNKSKYHIKQITSPTDSAAVKKQLVSKDKTTWIVELQVKNNTSNLQAHTKKIEDAVKSSEVKSYVTGAQILNDDFTKSTEAGIQKTEVIAVIFIFIVLIIVFRSPIVPLISLLTVGVSYITSLSIVANLVKNAGFPFSNFTQVFMVVVLFGIGTDYNILLYDQFKEELSRDDDKLKATGLAIRKAGKTILYSGSSVLIGFIALYFAKFSIYRSAAGVAIGVATLLVVLLTLNPFFMATLGRSMFWPVKSFDGGSTSKMWHNLSRSSVLHPLISLGIVLLVTLPFVFTYNNNLNYDDLAELSDTLPAKQGVQIVQKHFSKGTAEPSTLYIQSDHKLNNDQSMEVLDRVTQAVKKEQGIKTVASVTQPTSTKIQQLYLNQQLKTVTSGMKDAKKGTDTINSGLTSANQQLASSDMSGGLNQVGQLADGVNQLATGAVALSAGIEQLDTGSQSLSSNMSVLSNGISSYTNGVSQLNSGLVLLNQNSATLNSGANQLANGVSQLQAGGNQLANGLQQMSTQLDSSMTPSQAAQLQQLETALPQINNGLQQLNQALNGSNTNLDLTVLQKDLEDIGAKTQSTGSYAQDIGKQLQAIQSQSATDVPSTSTIASQLSAANLNLTDEQINALAQMLNQQMTTQMQNSTAQMQTNLQTIGSDATAIGANAQATGSDLQEIQASAQQLQSLSSSLGQLQGNVNTLATASNQALPGAVVAIQSLSTGLSNVQYALNQMGINSGAQQLASGLNTLNAGTSDLTSGLSQYTQGVSTAADGSAQLDQNSLQLNSGAQQLATGAQQLTTGLGTLSEQTPTFVAGLTQVSTGTQTLYTSLSSLTGQMQTLQNGLSSASTGLNTISNGITSANDYLTGVQDSAAGETFYAPKEVIHGNQLKPAIKNYLSEDKKAAKMTIVLDSDPASDQSMQKVANLQKVVKNQLKGTTLSNAKVAVGGQSAKLGDTKDIASQDFIRTAAIMLVGIILALMFVTRSILQPFYIIGTLLLAYMTSLGLDRFISATFLNQKDLTWNTPFFTFIMLIALGVDYSIFLMMRYREIPTSETPGNRIVQAASVIGAVVISAAIILSGTFAALMPSGVLTLIQVALGVIIGLIILVIILPVTLPSLIELTYGESDNSEPKHAEKKD